jgi:SAM-dependent methyltransferase
VTEAELDRARAAYRAAAGDEHPYHWQNPGYVLFMQGVERALLRTLAAAGVPLTGARVLDVGCGTGYYLHRLRDYGAGECHGVDLLEERVAAGRERYPALELQVGNAAELPFGDGEFDLVTQFTCLSSIFDDDVRLAAAREMRRVGAGGAALSFDLRDRGLPGRKRGGRETVALDARELRRLFGEPSVLRRTGLRFELAQLLGDHRAMASVLAALPPLRSHLIGIWRLPASGEPIDAD